MFSSTTFRPCIEGLESRTLLAGDVSVSVGEVLELRGDDAANIISITQDSTGVVLIEGLDGTRVDGQSSVQFNGSNLELVDVKLFDGNDELTMNGLRVSTDINIEMNGGDDTVNLQDVHAGVIMSVKMDDGSDRLLAQNIRTGSDFNIETGQGSSNVDVFSSTVEGTLKIVGLDSLDVVNVSDVAVGKDMQVNTGKGDDAVNIQDAAVTLTATIITDLGNDRVDVLRLNTGQDFNVEAGEGDDDVILADVTSSKNINVDVQTGDDLVGVTSVVATSDAVFLGGDGFDTFEDNGVSGGEKLEIKEFDQLVEPPLQAGDFNGNSVVEQGDLTLVLLNWGRDVLREPAAWTGPPPQGSVDQEELNAVLLNWGLSAATVPVPPTAPLREFSPMEMADAKDFIFQCNPTATHLHEAIWQNRLQV